MHALRRGLIGAVLMLCTTGRASAQYLEAEAEPAPRADVHAWADAHQHAAAREMVVGASMLTAGASLMTTRRGPYSYVVSMASVGALSMGTGSFALMHGAARLHVARALGRGVPMDVVQATELRRGRLQLTVGASLLVGSGLIGLSGLFIGAGGPNPAASGIVYGLVGAGGLSGVLLMEHGVYRVRFGLRGASPNVAWAPSVSPMRGGMLLGAGGAF
jgi:hypothetical protein